MGMNFQDVLRDVHDPENHQLKTSATVNSNSTVFVGTPTLYAVVNTTASSGLATITPLQAWPDPKTYIGLVTITGSLAAASGNVTLDPGSKTQIIGNLTLTDPKTYIGLTTSTIGNNPILGSGVGNIGFATVSVSNPTLYAVVNTGGANTGNITLNPSPNFIGLTTVVQASSARTITGNLTLSDAKTYIGLVTSTIGNSPVLGTGVGNIGFATVSVSNPTLYAVVNTTASSGFATVDVRNTINANVSLLNSLSNIGFATVALSTPTIFAVVNTTASNPGNTTLNPSPNFIGLVTVVQSSSARSIVGNLTLSDPKGFIGLVTVANNVTVTVDNIVGGSIDSIASSVMVRGEVVHGQGDDIGTAGPVKIGGYVRPSNVLSSTASGNRTNAWFDTEGRLGVFMTDPHTYIGLVTITGSLAAASGNVTLDAGSKTQIIGNLTLSDAKTFIGLTTTVLGNNSVQVFGQFLPTLQSIASGGLGPITLDQFGRQLVVASGDVVAGTTDSGNPVKVGGKFNSGAVSPALSDGQRGDLQIDSQGHLKVSLYNPGDTVTIPGFPDNLDAVDTTTSQNKLGVINRNTVFNGSSWDRVKTANVANATTGLGLLGAGVLGFDGTNYQRLSTDTSGKANINIIGNVTLADSKGFIGLVTVVGSLSPAAGNVTLDAGSKTQIVGNVTLSDSKTYIGLTTSTIGNNPVLGAGINNIGFATVSVSNPTLYAVVNTTASSGFATIDVRNTINANVSLSSSISNIGFATVSVSNPTLYAVVNTGAVGVQNSMVTINAGPNQIGSVTVSNTVPVSGTFYQSTQPVSFGNVTITDGKTYIGLVTSTIGNSPVLGSGVANIGFTTVNVSNATLYAVVNTGAAGVQNSMVTINPRTDYFGLVSVSGNVAVSSLPATPVGTNYIGLVSVSGNVAVSALPATPAGANLIGLVTVANTVPVTFSGNVTITDAKTYIGLVTSTIGNSPVLGSGVGSIGFATVNLVNQPALVASTANIGSVSVLGGTIGVGSLPATPTGANYIGLASINGSVVNLAGTNNIGSVSILGGVLNTITAITDITNPVALKGNLTLSDSKTYIGLTTATIGNSPILGSGVGNVGFATVSVSNPTLYAVVNTTAASGFATVNINTGAAWMGLATVYIGGPTIYAVVNTTASSGFATVNLNTGVAYAGLMSVNIGGTLPALSAGVANIGFASVTPVAAWPDPKGYIGLVTITGSLAAASGNVTLDDGSLTGIIGNVTLSDSKGFIGLVTAWTRNAGTAKTLVSLPVAMSTGSVATIAVPTNANTMYITNLLLNADATVRVTILSGVTYLAGNASIGITLNPGGGWVEPGRPDSPTYIGCPSGAIVIQKFDMTGTSAKIGGKIVYFQE